LLIDSLKYLPEDEKTKFFDEYERMARKSGML
jgi:hypothetical protein